MTSFLIYQQKLSIQLKRLLRHYKNVLFIIERYRCISSILISFSKLEVCKVKKSCCGLYIIIEGLGVTGCVTDKSALKMR